MTPEMILDYLGILVDTTKVPDLTFTANLILPEGNYVLRVKKWCTSLSERYTGCGCGCDMDYQTCRTAVYCSEKRGECCSFDQQEGDETCLTRLMDAVTVTSEYKYFNIIEP